MSVEKLIASHLRIASADLREARILFAAGGRNSVYLAEQAAEQIVLAIAQSEQIHYGRDLGHRLDRMLLLLPDANPIKTDLQRLSWLEAFATTYRYPKPSGKIAFPPESAKLEHALGDLEEILRMLADNFGVKLEIDATQSAKRSLPVRRLLKK